MSPGRTNSVLLIPFIFGGVLLLAVGVVLLVPEMAALTATVVYSTMVLLALLVPLAVSILLRQPLMVWALTVFAWLARIGLFAMLKAYSLSAGLAGFFPTDADAYLYHSFAVGALATGDWWGTLLERRSPPYAFVVAGLYDIAGIDVTVPQLLNLALGVLVVPLLYQLAARSSGHRSAIVAVIVWAVLPSGILWSISMVKDVWIVLGILLCAFALIAASRGGMTAGHVAAGMIGVAFIGFMRPPYLLIPALAMIFLMVAHRHRRVTIHQKLLVLLGSVAVIMAVSAAGIDLIGSLMTEVERSTSDEGVEQLARIALQGGSGIPFLLGLPPEIRWLAQLPFSMGAPFPWQWGSMGSGVGRIAALEMIVLYAVYASVARNWRFIWGRSEGKVLLLLALSSLLAVSFGLPNVGSLYRYRWPAVVLLLAAAPLAGRPSPGDTSRLTVTRRRIVPFRSAAAGALPRSVPMA